MKKIVILGSTGSIGENTVDLVSRFPDRFEVVALAAGKNLDRLEDQIRRVNPKMVSVSEKSAAAELRKRCHRPEVEILSGEEGLLKVASHPESDLAVSAIVGAKGLIPTLAALQSGQDIALANKESMVTAGELIGREAKRAGVRILPIDSEHSAIFQALAGNRRNEVRRVILTASGGPFLNHSRAERERATPESAIRHPRWNMGKKISVDSATLMNKGLEVIEAKWFFDLGWNEIEVLIHPQSIVHSMVEYIDGSVIAQLGIPDMRGPISYALGYPERVPLGFSSLDLTRVSGLTFAAPDLREFPCLSFGYEALRAGGTMPAVLNAANEEAVAAFLNHQIGFLKIEEVISRTMEGHRVGRIQEISDVLYADQWARKEALRAIEKIQGKA